MGAVRAPLPAAPGKPLRDATEYQRTGTANMFLAVEPFTGPRATQVTAQRTKIAWADFLQVLVDQPSPPAENICFVLDHLTTHTTASLYEAVAPPEAKSIAEKFASHSPPKQGSGFNMAAIDLSHLRRQCLGGRSAAKAPLITKVQAWNTQRHEKQAKAHWQFTTDDARVNLRRLYPIVST
jgi:DDE superfamily endonuclease